ncbi:MAG TPA: DUF1614 domain-containing protein, partial [Balneolaceae bacterium]|nr:DUF1614 domain-containing protein [Balneolaceae bacterium]
IATLINIIVCQIFARPVENLGIVMPTFIPALAAVASALILTPNHAPAVAFVSGVMGPLVGADLLHLQDIKKMNTRVASIGGAGTFDGIVISAMLATLLA